MSVVVASAPPIPESAATANAAAAAAASAAMLGGVGGASTPTASVEAARQGVREAGYAVEDERRVLRNLQQDLQRLQASQGERCFAT